MFAPTYNRHLGVADRLDATHAAIEDHEVVELFYRRADGKFSTREVRPLCLAFWGQVWTLGAWCEMREDFRNFRLDRIQSFHGTGR